jgi:phospholipid N-methyltransferase
LEFHSKIASSILSIDNGIIKAIMDAPETLKIYQNSEGALFIKEFIKSPRTIGAIYPSSRRLAKRMAKEVVVNENDIVIELGAGTGRVTKALLKHGISPRQLVVIERSPKLADTLRKKFSLVSVIEGNAANLLDLLNEYDQSHIRYIISSLPFRSLLPTITNAVMQQITQLLGSNIKLVQFTYSLRSKQPNYFADFKLLKSSIVWSNIPPARVNVFTSLE